jgi:hypothetical protein
MAQVLSCTLQHQKLNLSVSWMIRGLELKPTMREVANLIKRKIKASLVRLGPLGIDFDYDGQVRFAQESAGLCVKPIFSSALNDRN